MCLVSHVCRAVPHCPLVSTTQPLMPHSLVSPVTYQLAELGTWGPKLERSCQTSKQVIFYQWKHSAQQCPWGMGPCAQEPVGCHQVPRLSQLAACGTETSLLRAWASSISSFHTRHKQFPLGTQTYCRFTWFLITGLHLKHSVDFISYGNTTNSNFKMLNISTILYQAHLIKTHFQRGGEANENSN